MHTPINLDNMGLLVQTQAPNAAWIYTRSGWHRLHLCLVAGRWNAYVEYPQLRVHLTMDALRRNVEQGYVVVCADLNGVPEPKAPVNMRQAARRVHVAMSYAGIDDHEAFVESVLGFRAEHLSHLTPAQLARVSIALDNPQRVGAAA